MPRAPRRLMRHQPVALLRCIKKMAKRRETLLFYFYRHSDDRETTLLQAVPVPVRQLRIEFRQSKHDGRTDGRTPDGGENEGRMSQLRWRGVGVGVGGALVRDEHCVNERRE